MLDVWKRKRLRSWRCSPTSTTTAATDYWETFGSADTTYASSSAESVESTNWWSAAWQAWWILEGLPPDVFSCHWSTGSKLLASCSRKATQHSVVRWPAKGVVRVRTTSGRSLKTGVRHSSMDVPLMLLLSPGRNLQRILDPTTYLKDW